MNFNLIGFGSKVLCSLTLNLENVRKQRSMLNKNHGANFDIDDPLLSLLIYFANTQI